MVVVGVFKVSAGERMRSSGSPISANHSSSRYFDAFMEDLMQV